ncbi:MAG: MoaD/ThiS family protein [Brooklawnia sp.]|jgi:molybdopterin synthase sulfur carrier subunit
MNTCIVRFFAGAAEAAGAQTRSVQLPAGSSLADLVTRLGSGNEQLAKVLQVCTLLTDGRPSQSSDLLPAGQTSVDVLPPFAGG